MHLGYLRVSDFRNYRDAEFSPARGLTVVRGRNGQGKTNLVEAVSYLSSLSSFRGVPTEVLIRDGAERAALVATVDVDGRHVDLTAVINRRGPNRTELNGQRLTRARDLLGVLRLTVFTPDDLELLKAGPSLRRGYLDDLLVALRPSWDAVRSDLDRIVRQRTVLLKQAGPRPGPDVLDALDVWDVRLAEVGERLGAARAGLVEELAPLDAEASQGHSDESEAVTLDYEAPWRDVGLAAALAAARTEDLRRGVSTVGPHRDELRVDLRCAPARTHASQGEQRSLALALRLGGHHLVAQRHGTDPVIVLDDVFSELDAGRAAALVRNLPRCQTILTTVEAVPAGTEPELVVEVDGGRLVLHGAGGQPS